MRTNKKGNPSAENVSFQDCQDIEPWGFGSLLDNRCSIYSMRLMRCWDRYFAYANRALRRQVETIDDYDLEAHLVNL